MSELPQKNFGQGNSDTIKKSELPHKNSDLCYLLNLLDSSVSSIVLVQKVTLVVSKANLNRLGVI